VDKQGLSSAGASEERADIRTIGDVLKNISMDLQGMVRSEIRLARMEITDAAGRARSAGAMLLAGGVFAIFAAGFAFLTAMFALEIVLPAWLSALIVAVLLLIAASIGLSQGRQRLRAIRLPKDTMQTVKEDFRWISEGQKS
jgi:uncharacterized membrane protein YqjE